MGVVAPGSLHARFCSRPSIDYSGNFPACICRITFKHLPQSLRPLLQPLLCNFLFVCPNSAFWGGGGRGKFPKFLSLLNSSIFVIWEPMQKIWTTVTATCRLFPFSLANIGLFGEGGPQNLFLIGIPLFL